MDRDFTSTVAGLLASSSQVASTVTVAIELPSAFAEAVTLERARGGDQSAQIEMSYYTLERARISQEFRPDLVDAAIGWARRSAEVCDAGIYQLASALLFRAGALAGIGFTQSAEVDAAEGIALLDKLADAGYERAGAAIVQAIQALAEHGIGYGGPVFFHQEN